MFIKHGLAVYVLYSVYFTLVINDELTFDIYIICV